MKVFYIIILSLFVTSTAYTQKHFNNWYFGDSAGVTFNTKSGEPAALLNGVLKTIEGCSSISDNDGRLLFYTDGVTVWNRLHQVMKNGDSLYGHYSSSQSALIVPKPGTNCIYYIFTVGAGSYIRDPIQKGLNYSVVDMTLEKTLGEITQKNIPLLDTKSERLAATAHQNGKDIWIIANDSKNKTFVSYLLSADSLNSNPILSPHIADIHTSDIGMIKFSHNGKKLALTTLQGISRCQLYDFDYLNGKISNEKTFNVSDRGAYGLEFSKSGEFLYVTTENYFKKNELFQYNISTGDPATILSSEYKIFESNSLRIWGLQMGPNNKIYIANQGEYLFVIHNPNDKGAACNFKLNDVYLGGRFSSGGLPSVVQNYIPEKSDCVYNIIDICSDETIYLMSIYYPDAKYEWSGPNGYTSTLWNPVINNSTPEMSGVYNYRIIFDDSEITGSVNVTVHSVPKILFADTPELILVADSYELKAVEKPDGLKFKWIGVESDQNTVTINQNGTYKVIVEIGAGCIVTASVNIKLYKPYCEGDDITLDTYIKLPDITKYKTEYLWSGPNGYVSTDSLPVIHEVKVEMSGDYNIRIIVKIGTGDFEGEVDTIYTKVPVLVYPKVNILFSDLKEITICNDSLELKAVENPEKCDITWVGIDSKENTVIIRKSGIYTVYVENGGGCKDSAAINVKMKDSPDLEIIGGNIVCRGEKIELSANYDFQEYKWSTGDTTKKISVDTEGYYYLLSTDSNGCTDSAGINISEFGSNISIYEKQHDFDLIKSGNLAEFTFTIENNESSDITVKDIFIKNEPVHFELLHNTLPFVIKSNERTEIKVNFIPKYEVNISDSVVIMFSEPCNITDFITLSGSGKGEILVDFWLPDTTADIGADNFLLPVNVRLRDSSNYSFKTNITARIKFLRTLYNVDNLTYGQYSGENLKDSSAFNIEFNDVKISDELNIISDFVGKILLTEEGFTKVRIESLKFGTPYLIPIAKDGSIKTNEICNPDLKGIKFREGTFLTLKYDKIQGNSAIAYCGSAGDYKFSIFTIAGEMLYSTNWITDSKTEKYFELSEIISNSGLYFIVLNSVDGIDLQKVTLIK